MHLKIEKRATQGITILACHGRIMFGDEANLLRSVLRDVLTTNHKVVVDLADVNHLDSGGLGMLVGVRSTAKADGGDIKLSGLGQRLRDVLGLPIGDGTAQIMKLIIARQRVGRAFVP